jgi:hypothetical protein
MAFGAERPSVRVEMDTVTENSYLCPISFSGELLLWKTALGTMKEAKRVGEA